MAQTSKYDFRILLETVAGSKLSYYSSSFVDTSQELVLSASQVYHRITGSFSSSYVNSKFTSSAETFDVISGSGNTFGENKLLSASLSGSLNTGSIVFTALDTEYDRLLRYRFIGDKVCNVLGLPSEQWVYVDQVRLAPDDDSNYFEGNIKAHSMFIDNSIQISNTAHVDSNIPILIHTQSAESSDRFLKFVEVDGVPKNSLLLGYNASASRYELSSSTDTTFEIANVDDIRASKITSSNGFYGGVHVGARGIFGAAVTSPEAAVHIHSADIMVPNMSVVGLHNGADNPVLNTSPRLSMQFHQDRGLLFRHDSLHEKLIISGGDQHARIGIGDDVDYDEIDAQLHVFGDLKVTGTGSFGKVHTRIVSSSIMFSSGSNIFGDATTDTHTFNGNITGSNHISVSGDITTKDIYVENVYRFIGDTVRMSEDTVGDNLSITGGGLKIARDMTASGAISASGFVMGDQIKSNGVKVARYRTDLGLTRFGSANYPTVITGSPSITLGESSGCNITASGNISASGDLSVFGEVVHLEGTDPRLKLKAKGANHPGVEWHEDSTRKWILYSDPDSSQGANDNLTFKNASDTELMELDQDGRLYVSSKIFHLDDIDTFIDFTTDDINIQAGGVNMFDFTQNDGSQDEITFNEAGADLDVRIEGDTDANLLFTDAGNDKVGIGTNAPTKKLTVEGDISGSGNVYAKTFRSEHLFSFKTSAVDGEEYYFAIGGNPLNDVISSANAAPSPALTHTAMCNLSIKRLKIQFSLPVAGISTFKIYCRRWDGNSGFDADGNWETIGTVWTVKSAAINDNERFYHAPSDWNINVGEIWGLQWEANGSTPSVFFNGGIVIEENWNTLISS